MKKFIPPGFGHAYNDLSKKSTVAIQDTCGSGATFIGHATGHANLQTRTMVQKIG